MYAPKPLGAVPAGEWPRLLHPDAGAFWTEDRIDLLQAAADRFEAVRDWAAAEACRAELDGLGVGGAP